MLKRGWQFGIGCALAWLSVALLYAVASYPSSVHAFPTRVDGQTIAASWFNEIHDEVVAIENALLNGFQHDLKFTDGLYDIGKSGATRPRDGFFSRNVSAGGTLTATGATTLSSTVGVTGVSTLSDDVKIAATKKLYLDGGGDTYVLESAANTVDLYTNGARALTVDSTQFIDSPTQPRASAYNSTTQSINDATGTALTFNSEDFDVGAMHDTGANTSRVTIPAGGDGLYLLIGQTTFAPNATGIRQMWFKKNGTTDIGGFQKSVSNSVASATSLVTSQLAVLAAADYVELFATQNSGGALNVGDSSRVDASALQVVKLW